MKITLGEKVKDSITGFTGIAIARTTWLNGCDRISVQPVGVNKDGKKFETETFDEPDLIVLKPAKKRKVNKDTGGPRPEVYKQKLKI